MKNETKNSPFNKKHRNSVPLSSAHFFSTSLPQWKPSPPTTTTGAHVQSPGWGAASDQKTLAANRRPAADTLLPQLFPHPRLLRHGRSKANEAGIIVSKMVRGKEVGSGCCTFFLPFPIIPFLTRLPHHPGKRRQARVRAGRRRQRAGQGGRVRELVWLGVELGLLVTEKNQPPPFLFPHTQPPLETATRPRRRPGHPAHRGVPLFPHPGNRDPGR